MNRKSLLSMLLCVLPGMVFALGLGNLELESGLNQPFKARIQLLSATADELQSLRVGLADTEAFRRADINRPFILSKLRFQVEEHDDGPDYIGISSRDSIREPFLNFLIEASWSRGRLFREYTVLLDPPLYNPNASRTRLVAEPEPVVESFAEPEEYVAEVAEAEELEHAVFTPAVSHYAGDDYGPTTSTDTLWSIAKQMRPDTSVSVQRMMLALQRTNPEAFLKNNINGLKRGQILRLPDNDVLNELTQQQALEEVRAQYSMWDAARSSMAAATPDRPVTAADGGFESVDSDEAMGVDDEDAELRLVAATDTEAGAERGVGSEAGAENLALVNEQLEAISQENLELKDSLSEAESIIDDLKRLIELKDDELAAIQQQQISGEQIDELGLAEDEIVEEAQEEFIGDDAEDLFAEDSDDALSEEELFDDEMASEEDEDTPAQDVVEDEQEVEQTATAEPVQPAAGMLDQIMALIMNNLMIVAGALGGFIVLVALFLFMSRRKQSVAKESDAVATEFPDFSASEDETAIPAEETQDSISSEAATELSEEETTASVETEEAEQPQVADQEPAAEEPVEEPQEEEDPLAEVNVFLAYEHFDQAEEFVKNAIADDPNNLDFQSKLLEVFYAAGNKQGYEEAARVLHDQVDGQGSYWDMALAMWQELSPNRALFEAGGEAEDAETAAADTGGGLLDLTAEESDGSSSADVGLDFDLGSEETEGSAVAGSDDGVLDLTAGQDDVLDVTAAISTDGDEDILDVTAAVGLDTVETELEGAAEDQVLDITTGNDDDDLLDVSHSGSEDLLDVSAHADLGGSDIEEDLLDVTSATSAGADADELLGISTDEGTADAVDDNALDFDIGGLGTESADSGEAATAEEDNILEFDIGVSAADEADDGLDLSIGDENADDDSIALDVDTGMDDADNDISLVDTDDGFDSEAETMQIQLDEAAIEGLDGDADSTGLEVDLSVDEEPQKSTEGEDPGVEFDLTIDDEAVDSDDTLELPGADLGLDEASTEDDMLEISLDLDTDDDEELDMDGTVEMPNLSLEIDDDEGDDEDHTVFVPRTSDTPEQSAEDEIATKLDLAKAYVELGDKDSAKAILDEIITDGNEQQREQAQELLNQVS